MVQRYAAVAVVNVGAAAEAKAEWTMKVVLSRGQIGFVYDNLRLSVVCESGWWWWKIVMGFVRSFVLNSVCVLTNATAQSLMQNRNGNK